MASIICVVLRLAVAIHDHPSNNIQGALSDIPSTLAEFLSSLLHATCTGLISQLKEIRWTEITSKISFCITDTPIIF